jgi:hypothetical protein
VQKACSPQRAVALSAPTASKVWYVRVMVSNKLLIVKVFLTGSFAASTGLSVCQLCGVGTYAQYAGMSQCPACSACSANGVISTQCAQGSITDMSTCTCNAGILHCFLC